MTRIRRHEKSLAVALVAVQAVLVGAVVVLGEAGRAAAPFSESSLALDTFGAVTSMAFAVVGLVIVVRRPGNAIGWLFLLSNLGWDVSNAATAWVEFGLRVAPLPAVDLVAWFATWPGPLSLAAYVLLILLFPDGRAASTRWAALARFAIGWGVVHAALSALAAGPIEALQLEGLEVANPFALPDPAGSIAAGLAYGLLELLSVGLIAVATVSLIVRLRRAHGVEREQLKWLAAAVAVTAVMNILNVPIMIAYTSLADAPAWARAANAILTSGGFLIPIAAAIAILRYRLYDIDRIISRTVTYGFVTAVLAATYAGAFVAFQAALAPVTERSGPVTVATSTLVVFALFAPVRSRMRAIVDRRFDRSRYDAEQTIDAFVAGVRDEVDVERVSHDLAATLERTMHPATVGVWLRDTVRSA